MPKSLPGLSLALPPEAEAPGSSKLAQRGRRTALANSRLAKALAIVSVFLSSCLCTGWLIAPESAGFYLKFLIRPDSSVGALLCALCVALHASGTRARPLRTLKLAFGFAAVGAGCIGMVSVVDGEPFSLVGQLPFGLSHAQAHMAPLAAIEILATGIASLLLHEGRSARRNVVASALSLFSMLLSAGFLFSASFAVSSFHSTDPHRLMLPAAALTLLFENLALLMVNPSHRLIRYFIGDHPAAMAARRLLLMSSFGLFLVGTTGVALQGVGLINYEEGAALMSCMAGMLLVFILYGHAKLVHEMITSKMTHLRDLQNSLRERRRLVEQLSCDRARLEGVLHAAVNHCIIATDENGLIEMFTEGAEAILKYRAEEVVGKLNLIALHDTREVLARAETLGVPVGFDVLRALPTLGMCDQREWTYITKDQQRIPVFLSMSALQDENRRIVGYVGIARDISNDKRAQQERDAFLEIGQELLIVANAADGSIHRISPSFERLLGYRPSDLLGRDFFDFVHPADRNATLKAVETLQIGVVIERFENRWRDKSGRYHWLSWDASVPYTDGLIYSGAWDITEDKRRAAEVAGLLANEQHLIGVVSHDLRNPISAISMSAQLILRQSDAPKKVCDHASRIVSACTKAERLIHSILDLSQARSGQGLSITPEEIDATDIAERTVEELRLAHPMRDFRYEAPPEAVCYADSDRVAQVLGNLLSNAVKYGAEQSPVTLKVEDTDTDIALAVHNAGPPIPKQAIANLFKPMLRGSGPSGHAQRNIGLGLYIVNEIVQRHGGTIDVESSADAGTTFRVLLPKSALRAMDSSAQPEVSAG